MDLFPLGARDAAFERLSALLTSLRDVLTTLRASEAPPAGAGAGAGASSGSNSQRPQILLADLAKKAAESDAKAYKWEIEELRNTIAGLRDELSKFFFLHEKVEVVNLLCEEKVKAEKKPAPTGRLQDIPTAHDKLASYLPPTDEVEASLAVEPQYEMDVTDPEPNVCCFLSSSVHAHRYYLS